MKKLGFLSNLTVLILGVLILVPVIHASAATKAEYNWTIAACMMPQSGSGRAFTLFGDLLEKYSNGRIKIKGLHLAGEVCCEKSCIDQLDFKAIDVAGIGVGNYGTFSNILRVIELPYIFDSIEVTGRILSGPILDRIIEKIENYDKRKFIVPIPDGVGRHLWTNIPVKTPSDITAKHMKIRSVYSSAENQAIKEWGAIPTPVPWGELYQALQSKLVNGHLLQNEMAEIFKTYEAAPYCTEIGYKTTLSTLIFMNLDYWNSLPEDIQKVVLRAGKEALKWAYDTVNKFNNESKERMIKQGVASFYTPKPDEMEQWRDLALKAWKKLRPQCDEELLNLILKAQNKTFPE